MTVSSVLVKTKRRNKMWPIHTWGPTEGLQSWYRLQNVKASRGPLGDGEGLELEGGDAHSFVKVLRVTESDTLK